MKCPAHFQNAAADTNTESIRQTQWLWSTLRLHSTISGHSTHIAHALFSEEDELHAGASDCASACNAKQEENRFIEHSKTTTHNFYNIEDLSLRGRTKEMNIYFLLD